MSNVPYNTVKPMTVFNTETEQWEPLAAPQTESTATQPGSTAYPAPLQEGHGSGAALSVDPVAESCPYNNVAPFTVFNYETNEWEAMRDNIPPEGFKDDLGYKCVMPDPPPVGYVTSVGKNEFTIGYAPTPPTDHAALIERLRRDSEALRMGKIGSANLELEAAIALDKASDELAALRGQLDTAIATLAAARVQRDHYKQVAYDASEELRLAKLAKIVPAEGGV